MASYTATTGAAGNPILNIANRLNLANSARANNLGGQQQLNPEQIQAGEVIANIQELNKNPENRANMSNPFQWVEGNDTQRNRAASSAEQSIFKTAAESKRAEEVMAGVRYRESLGIKTDPFSGRNVYVDPARLEAEAANYKARMAQENAAYVDRSQATQRNAITDFLAGNKSIDSLKRAFAGNPDVVDEAIKFRGAKMKAVGDAFKAEFQQHERVYGTESAKLTYGSPKVSMQGGYSYTQEGGTNKVTDTRSSKSAVANYGSTDEFLSRVVLPGMFNSAITGIDTKVFKPLIGDRGVSSIDAAVAKFSEPYKMRSTAETAMPILQFLGSAIIGGGAGVYGQGSGLIGSAVQGGINYGTSQLFDAYNKANPYASTFSNILSGNFPAAASSAYSTTAGLSQNRPSAYTPNPMNPIIKRARYG